MRKHKIDLSRLACSPSLDVVALVRQVPDADRLCLFLTQVGENETLSASLVNDVCTRLRAALLAAPPDEEDKWIPAILTSWVQQKPSKVPV